MAGSLRCSDISFSRWMIRRSNSDDAQALRIVGERGMPAVDDGGFHLGDYFRRMGVRSLFGGKLQPLFLTDDGAKQPVHIPHALRPFPRKPQEHGLAARILRHLGGMAIEVFLTILETERGARQLDYLVVDMRH